MKALEGHLRSGRPEFVVIYGRRRVGKTELTLHSVRDKPSVYFLAEEKKYADNLEDMKVMMADFLKDEEFRMIQFKNWAQLFKSFLERAKGRTVVIIDEFPYLVRENKAIASEFQKIWDLYLSKTDAVLVLVGSSISMMEKLLGRKSPLFGRRTAQFEVKPVDIFHAHEFLPGYSMEDCISVYGCTDGIPLYLRQFNEKLAVFENIRTAFFRKDSLLYSEAEILMKQEFRQPANYFAILKAISFGNTKQNEISNHAGIDKTIISKYLQNLERIRVVRREYPVTEKKEKRKNARYAFSDNYFRFWFRFVYPNRALIESRPDEAFEIMKKEYGTYLGLIFEKVAAEFLWRNLELKFTRLGRWWHKDSEIDLVALNEITKEILFFECKWRHLRGGEERTVLNELKAKSIQVDWQKDNRKETFGIIAKHIANKNELKKEGYLAFDFEDFKRVS